MFLKASHTSGIIRPKHIEREITMSSMMNAIESGKETSNPEDKDVDDDTESRDRTCLPCGVTEFIVNACMKPSRIHGAKATMNVRAVHVDQGS